MDFLIRTIIIKIIKVRIGRGEAVVNLKSNNIPKAEAVEPIKNKKDVKKLVEFLHITNIRNYAIVVLGINTLLRAGDLLSLTWKDVLEDENTL